jgi:hypothetical protein
MRVTKLRELSGSLWDQDNFMITLEESTTRGMSRYVGLMQFN